ncbi:glycosyltransferase [Priestia filamentosa]|uniref:glycosyltransferase n=1 Tax=Priestia filamentosa TaxID=1402861 RepID=UPI00234AAFD9|nr:glycosyltransferase [Priestia filamentosa]WCM14577.1 glycosyltransferase [Priestia filamentosa]
MKILHVINSLSSGGAEKLIEDSLPLMNRIEGIEVEVLLLTNHKNVFDKGLRNNNIKISVLPKNRIRSLRNIYDIRQQIIKGRYDIVHAHLFPSNYWVSLACMLFINNRPKLVVTEHNTHNRRRNKKYFKYIDKFIYSSFDKIISISEKTQENLILWINPSEENQKRFTVVDNGVNLQRFFDAKPYNKSEINLQFDENVKLVCMTGRFTQQKDQNTLIKAIKNLPQNVHLLLIGEGELKKQNEELAKNLGVSNRVHFMGFRNDVDRILCSCEIVALSSHWEGFGLAAVEGMAVGKPLIASNVSGLKEVVNNYGMLFEKGNVKEVTNLISKLLKDENLYNELSKKSLIRAQHYDIKVMVNKYINVYKN